MHNNDMEMILSVFLKGETFVLQNRHLISREKHQLKIKIVFGRLRFEI